MSQFKETFEKLSREQQLAALQQMEEVVGKPDADARKAADEKVLREVPYMSPNEFDAYKARMFPACERAVADDKAKRAAEARGFEVSRKE